MGPIFNDIARHRWRFGLCRGSSYRGLRNSNALRDHVAARSHRMPTSLRCPHQKQRVVRINSSGHAREQLLENDAYR